MTGNTDGIKLYPYFTETQIAALGHAWLSTNYSIV